MIQTVSKLYVMEDKINEFLEVFKGMIEPTQKEKGYIEYEIYQDEEDPALLIVLEKWESKEDFDNHLQSKHFNKIVPEMVKLMRKEGELNICKRAL
ncbi:antibiotic biosynthesis monooxygenase [Propionigenium maris DSM 9537]|uniref:Antibiotic biosynthesis monooxygenase n=1 Tax=Propionigenium maris DSM 9537 TaxID=1123000 RepID=A0A9W6GI19_9FUSO|nr:putative quinol monooxygenase [Propionigenium maris]GLI54550.1 antibiotic biosynthesis monooxygenase [Propionigenium maris DSM 9537]